MPSARVSRPGSSNHGGISWERGEKDGASVLKGMGVGEGLYQGVISKGTGFCPGQRTT